MPLKRGVSNKIKIENIRLLIREGKSIEQAVAIANQIQKQELKKRRRRQDRQKINDYLAACYRSDQRGRQAVPVTRFPMSIALDYSRDIYNLFLFWYDQLLNEVRLQFFGRLDSKNFIIVYDDLFSDFVSKWRLLVAGGFSGTITATGNKINSFNKRNFQRQVKKILNIDIFSGDPWLQTELDLFTEQNVALISNIGVQAAGQIQTLVTNAVRSGTSTTELTKQLRNVKDFGQDKARLIARDQIGKFLGVCSQQRQTEFGVKKYEWSTSGDNRVRKTHRANDGQVFDWNKPPATTGHPGQDIQCRCTAIPIFEDV